MSAWDDLARELDAWADAGRTATLWWRDDDATAPTAELERLLALQAEHGPPLALAVIPGRMARELPARLDDHARGGHDISVLQHGYRHLNHAPEGEKKMELGAHRPAPLVVAELAAGWQALDSVPRRLAVLVPPWNRIAPRLVPMLPELGYRGLSGFGPRQRAAPVAGLRQVNTHVDPVDWRHGRRTLPDAAIAAQATQHLAARRSGRVDEDEATGLLTHHLLFDDGAWAAAAVLFRTASHPAARWLSARDMFEYAKPDPENGGTP